MDLGFILFSVCVMMISPLGDVRCSAGDAIDCPCPAIPSVNRTQPPPETCFQIDSHFRYNCTKGYVRKAGTSNLIKCQKEKNGKVAKWMECSLQCIPDPKITPTLPVEPGNVTETKPMVGTSPASTTAVPSQRSTVEPHMHELTSNITRISIVSLVVVFACAGISFYCYKRRTKNMIPVRTSEEDVPMDDIQSQNRVCSQPATAAESSRLNGDQDCGV